MMKLVKIIGVLLLLVLLAVAALIITFDANNYKAQIIEQVEKQTGRDFTIEGDINLSLFPWVGLKVEKTSLANARGFSDRAFAEIAQLDIKVMLLPLLFRELEVDTVLLRGLSVSLEVDDQERNNWSDLSESSAKGDTGLDKQNTKTDETAQASTKSGAALAGFAVNGIELVDANIRWSDATTNTLASVSELSLKTSAIRFNEPVNIAFSARMASNQPEIDAKISLQTKLVFDQALNNFDANDLKLNVQSVMQSISKDMIALDIKTGVKVDLKLETAYLQGLEVSALGAVLKGNLAISQLISNPKVKGAFSSNNVDGRAVAKKLQVDLPPMANPDSLSSVSLETRLEASSSSVRLDKIIIGLDQSQITGKLDVLDLELPRVSYNLKLNSINLDDYMAPVSAETEQVAAQQNTAGMTANGEDADVEIPLPVELLRTLVMNGVFSIEKATILNIEVTDTSIRTQAGSGLVRVKPITMNLLDGRIDAGIDLDVGQVPAYSIVVNASDLKAGPVVDPLLKGMMGEEEEITLEGVVQLRADIKTQGGSLLVLKKAATGTVNFDMNQASVTGVDIQYFARNAIVDYLEEKKLDVNPEWRGEYIPNKRTAFRKVHASAVIAQGKISNDDFIMDSKHITVTGKGEVNIVDNSMDYYSLIDLTPERKQTFAEKLLDEPMGVHIHGPFEMLAIDPDKTRIAKAVKNLLADKAKSEVTKKVEEKKEDTRNKIQDKLKNKLKDLF